MPHEFSATHLPRRIKRLADLAYNVWWTWNPDAMRLFARLDPQLWDAVNHNPVKFLNRIDRKDLNAALADIQYLDSYDRAIAKFDSYLADSETWFATTFPEEKNNVVAYFSMEFGLHESLPIYAGGLGVLSGDHSKEASDLGLPFVGVGFIYQQGYFRQHITEDGWQEAYWETLDVNDLPVRPAKTPTGEDVIVSVELPGRTVKIRVWEIRVGRAPLFLMDTNVDSNSPADRELTARLYSSDLDIRITQEIVLGIGGVRALRAMNIHPRAWHMNEGHSAFIILERIAELVQAGTPLAEAERKVRASTAFTTHTPVPAGNEAFPLWLIDKYFPHYWDRLGLDRDAFMALAKLDQSWGPSFSMPALAIHFSEYCNAVSELHGQVSREMWSFLWPDKKADEASIGSITNGVHTGSWLARRLRQLFDRSLGSDWYDHLDDPETWASLLSIPDDDLWNVHRHLKRRLQIFMNDRARAQWLTAKIHPVQIIAAGALLDPNALTIGFARRFATYKRAGLLFRDIDRLLKLVNRPGMPVQFVFAGKAHPADDPGKKVIQDLYRAIKRAEFAGRLIFIEDYDQNIARHLVQGCDVWLNTPRRPHEASGTSGQKAAVNGVLNCSILDGWWPEGYNGENGWAIGAEETLASEEEQDAADSESLFNLLENEIVPLYYNRDERDLPRQWIRKMKESIATLAPLFSTRRMLKDYVNQMYIPAMQNGVKVETQFVKRNA
ncbi:MAG TPA: alpha-glucan family phosphorylase [Anaerolineales bacterium]|nr:alpha-glucan family phosphorylase [Anaerolineales bacterium]